MNEQYYCNKCELFFNNLIQYQKNDKMFQLCPFCYTENIRLNNFTDAERLQLIRYMKLKRILN